LAGAASASWRIQQQPQRIADHSYSAQRRQTLTDTIAAGVSDGQFPERVDPEAASAALSGAVFYRRLMTADESNDDFIAQLIDTVLG
jgi:TetR/AcrR family transcriptional regulator, regulator of autoinduction and epiphytic fitness